MLNSVTPTLSCLVYSDSSNSQKRFSDRKQRNPSPGLRPPSPHPMGRGKGEGLPGKNFWHTLYAFLLATGIAAAAQEKATSGSDEQAILKGIKAPHGFSVTLFAAP